MSNIENFLSLNEETAIIEAIRKAEITTSGEIRVHIEQNCESDVFEHAIEIFHHLKMDTTKQRNGVLIYIAVDKKAFVIYGDKGINDVVETTFWNTTKDLIASHFKDGKFASGIIKGIETAGDALSKYFPALSNDVNELDNSISKG